ncbi:hypothetical protein HDK77DRAFT_256849 [Phyllosticta capitalensis]
MFVSRHTTLVISSAVALLLALPSLLSVRHVIASSADSVTRLRFSHSERSICFITAIQKRNPTTKLVIPSPPDLQ